MYFFWQLAELGVTEGRNSTASSGREEVRTSLINVINNHHDHHDHHDHYDHNDHGDHDDHGNHEVVRSTLKQVGG